MYIIDIWRIIFDFCDFKSKINLTSLNHYFRRNLKFSDMYQVRRYDLKKLSNHILKQVVFSEITNLCARDNIQITDVSMFCHLKQLNIANGCGVGQDSIDRLNLVKYLT